MTPGTKQDLDGALRKAAAVWLRTPGHPDLLVWALWPTRALGALPAGCLVVACGGTDQHVPGLLDGAAVTVTVARPGSRTTLAEIDTVARLCGPDEQVAAALVAARRNAGAGWTEVFALPLLASVARSSPAAPLTSAE